jgi:hypothetical protein
VIFDNSQEFNLGYNITGLNRTLTPYLQTSTTNLQDCANECKVALQCTHFQYSGESCSLFQTPYAGSTVSIGSTTGYVNCRSNQTIDFEWYLNGSIYSYTPCNFVGYDYANITTNEESVCSSACLNDQKCSHFTLKPNFNICNLKNAKYIQFRNLSGRPDLATTNPWRRFWNCGFIRNRSNQVWSRFNFVTTTTSNLKHLFFKYYIRAFRY